MAEEKKQDKEPRKKRGTYEKPLKIKGTFAQVIKAAVKDKK